jgi:5,5'-dehydrodivanillate O-demethylase
MEQPYQRKVDQLVLLPQTGPDTPMGILLRKFWHPIAVSSELPKGKAVAVRLLSEDLTLYRGESGTIHLIGGRCAHRCTVLHTGWVQGDQIRCMYHGWLYDGSGVCNEIPAERQPRQRKVKIPGYGAHEYCGLIFAYIGETPVPEFDLLRKPVMEGPQRRIIHQKQTWDCNWFQHVENSLDALHVSFAHLWGKAGRFGSSVTAAIPELSYKETSAGILQVATRPSNNVRKSDWTFPNCNHVVVPGPNKDDPWVHLSAWAVPVDDTHTMRFTIYAIETTDDQQVTEIAANMDLGYDPAMHYDELFNCGIVSALNETGLLSAQDYVAVRGQGIIYDRSQETLSSSDAGLAFLRRIFLRELDAIREGRPTKTWTRLAQEEEMTVPPVAAE